MTNSNLNEPDEEYEYDDIDNLDNDDSIELIFMYYNDYKDDSFLQLFIQFKNSFQRYFAFREQGYGEGNPTDEHYIAELKWFENLKKIYSYDKSFIKKCIDNIKSNRINISNQIVKNFNTHYDDMKNKQRTEWVNEVNDYIIQNSITIDPDQSIEEFTESLKYN